jgi:DNA-binding response OmpR family regulator
MGAEKTMPTKILAIDDDAAMTELLTLLLKSHGFEVTTANSSEKGIDLIRKIRPDIILLDLMMPQMDGWETCKKIRKFSNIPIVVLSALNNPGMVASALDAGADDYLIKPVPSSILVAHIKNLARRNTAKLNPSKSMMRSPTKPIFS